MRRRYLRTPTLVLAVILIASACSTADQATDAGAPATTESATTTASSATAPSTTTAQQTTTTAAAPDVEPLLAGATPVLQGTPTEGVGLRPTLSWEAVDGADTYFLVVKDDTGLAYWSWLGTESSVPLGGAAFPEDIGNGPTIGPGYTWSVSAYAPDGTLLAISGDRPIAP